VWDDSIRRRNDGMMRVEAVFYEKRCRAVTEVSCKVHLSWKRKTIVWKGA